MQVWKWVEPRCFNTFIPSYSAHYILKHFLWKSRVFQESKREGIPDDQLAQDRQRLTKLFKRKTKNRSKFFLGGKASSQLSLNYLNVYVINILHFDMCLTNIFKYFQRNKQY